MTYIIVHCQSHEVNTIRNTNRIKSRVFVIIVLLLLLVVAVVVVPAVIVRLMAHKPQSLFASVLKLPHNIF